MSDVKISELPSATELDGSEETVVVQGGETRRAQVSGVVDGLPGDRTFNFDAGGDENAARPSEAAATDTVRWFNVPSEPTNLGTFDVWEDA